MVAIPNSPHDFVALLAAHDNTLGIGDVPSDQRAAWRRALYALISSDAVPDGYCIKHTGRDRGDLTVRLVRRAENEPAPPAASVPVPTRLTNLHPLIAATRSEAGSRKTGWIDTRRQTGMLHVNVTGGHVFRVLLLAQALVDEAERRGHQAGLIEQYGCPGGLGISVGAHAIELVFTERTRRVGHDPTTAEREDQERYSWSYAPRWDYLPSGTIELRAGHTVHDHALEARGSARPSGRHHRDARSRGRTARSGTARSGRTRARCARSCDGTRP